MVSIKWCMKQSKGIRIISPNKNMSESYLGMAEESIYALFKKTTIPVVIVESKVMSEMLRKSIQKMLRGN